MPCSAFVGSSEPASQAGTPARPRPEAGEGRGGRCDRPHCDHPVTVVKWCHQQDGAPRVPRETGSYVSRLVRAFRLSSETSNISSTSLFLLYYCTETNDTIRRAPRPYVPTYHYLYPHILPASCPLPQINVSKSNPSSPRGPQDPFVR